MKKNIRRVTGGVAGIGSAAIGSYRAAIPAVPGADGRPKRILFGVGIVKLFRQPAAQSQPLRWSYY
jgi:hypothetical protein